MRVGLDLSTQFRVFSLADGADVIDYLNEIPLSGRVLAPPLARTSNDRPKTTPIGFVAGAENRLVASTLIRLMQSAPSPFTPRLFALFGRSGTGKTHIAQGLVRYWNESRGENSAIYLTAGDFYRQLLDAVKRHSATDFRRDLRNHKLIAIDDLHQLPSDEYVSRELRFTLDAYDENGGTIIIGSRRPANTLANISADLRSRLAAALTLQLATPGNSARIRIIRRASESLGRPLSEQIANRLASSVNGTANDLFGAMFEICTPPRHASEFAPVDLGDDAEQFAAARRARQPQLREILAVIGRYFKLPQKQLKSHSRRRSIVAARAVAIYLARELAGVSYEQIGRALGGRDHTTIIHSYRKIQRDRPREPAIQEAIEELSRILLTP